MKLYIPLGFVYIIVSLVNLISTQAPIRQCDDATCGFDVDFRFTPNNTVCPCTMNDIGGHFTTCNAMGTKSLFYYWSMLRSYGFFL